MDFFNRALAQITDLFRSMTPGARITAGLLLAVVVVSLGYLFNHQSTSADAFLLGGDSVPSTQLSTIEAAFAKAKLSGYEIDAGHRIHVPSAQKAAYMAALADANALPKGFGDHLISMVKDGGFFPSMYKQKEMQKIGLERELSQIISSMRGIESAAVMYDIQTEVGLHDKPLAKTASVSVKPQGGDPLEEDRVRSIRQLVAGAIGCKPTDVSVVDMNTDRTFAAGGSGGSSGSVDNQYGAAKRMYEKDWQEKIRNALSYVPNVVVATNVDVNPEVESKKDVVSVDPKPVPVSVSEDTTTSTTSSNPVGGPPGAASNGLSNRPASITAGNNQKSDQEVSKTRQTNVVGQSTTSQVLAGLTPARVSVTIGVPSSYYENIWRERNPTPVGSPPKTPEPQQLAQIETTESKKIHEFVVQLLPVQLTPDKVDPDKLVQVSTFQHIASTPIALPTIAEQGLFWLSQYWSTLGMIGLGMASLVMLRSMTKTSPASAQSSSESAAEAIAEEADAGQEPATAQMPSEAAARLKRRAKSGPSLRDDLVEIVREDPDAAANILRNWIGTAT